MLPIECVVRGYLAGSGWKDYQRTGAVCGIPLPDGPARGRPAAAADLHAVDEGRVGPRREHHRRAGHRARRRRALPRGRARLRSRSTSARPPRRCARGIILADTKFEFGLDGDGALVLGDEVLTPDSSRFWPADSYAPGTSPPTFDKQFVRDWLETLDWDKTRARPRAARRRARRHGRALPRGLRAARRDAVRGLPRGDGSARVKVTVLVRPKEGILDPQGEAIASALQGARLPGERRARREACSTSSSTSTTAAEAERVGREVADRVLANGLIERFEVVSVEAQPRSWPSEPPPAHRRRHLPRHLRRPRRAARGRAPRRRARRAVARRRRPRRRRRRARARRLLVRRLPALRRDRPLRAGDARRSPAFAAAGGPVLGVCNGFQVLCEAGLLPGVLRPNHHGRFVCRDVDLVVEHAGSPWCGRSRRGDVLRDPGQAPRRRLVRAAGRARARSRPRPGRCCATPRTRTAHSPTSRASPTRPATSSA